MKAYELFLPLVFHMNPSIHRMIDRRVMLYKEILNGVCFLQVDLTENGTQTPIIHINLKLYMV